MAAPYLGYGAIAAALGAIAYSNLPTRYTIGAVVPTAQYLAEARLKKLDSERDVLTASEIKVLCCGCASSPPSPK